MLVANARRPFAVLDGISRKDHARRIERGMACLVVLIGAYDQIHDALMPPASAWSDLHVGFGGLLLCTILWRIHGERAHSAESPAAGCWEARRQLARMVYILIYGLAGLRELANLTVHLSSIAVRSSGDGSPPQLPTMESFQIYLTYGIIAIVAIRMSGAVGGATMLKSQEGGGS